MLRHIKNTDPGSMAVIAITFILFTAALFIKGFTHDLLLEAAVFLVSVKLIILSYKTNQSVKAIQDKLDLIFNEEIRLEELVTALRKPESIELKR